MQRSRSAECSQTARYCYFPARQRRPTCWIVRGCRGTSLKYSPSRYTRRICWRGCVAKALVEGCEAPVRNGRFAFVALNLTAAFERARHRDLIGIFDVAAGGDAGGDARDAHWKRLEQIGEQGRGSFAFERWASGEDGLVDLAALSARGEGAGAQMFRADAVERRERAMQHVVDAVVMGALDDANAGRLLDYADLALVARGAG